MSNDSAVHAILKVLVSWELAKPIVISGEQFQARFDQLTFLPSLSAQARLGICVLHYFPYGGTTMRQDLVWRKS